MTEIIQGSDEWKALRCGKVTASRIADLCAKTKTGWGASRNNYMAELLIERLTGQPAPSYMNDAMRWGTEQEPSARAAYEFRFDTAVVAVGFVQHPLLPSSGASPDGLIGDDGLIEIKCPQSATHISTLLGEPIADRYIKQMHWQMACTDRVWCDWISYDPRLPESMQLFVKRVQRNDALIREIEGEVRNFLFELAEKQRTLRERYEAKQAA